MIDTNYYGDDEGAARRASWRGLGARSAEGTSASGVPDAARESAVIIFGIRMIVKSTEMCQCGLPVALLSDDLYHTIVGDLHTCGTVPGDNWPKTFTEMLGTDWASDATGFRG